MNNNYSKIAFLFGSGISIPSKIPGTKDISKIIFNEHQIVRDSSENFFFDDPKKFEWSLYKEVPKRVQNFLKILKSELEEYYKDKDRSINYEDVFYLLDFIEYNYYEKEGNPAFKYIFKEFEPKIERLLVPLDPLLQDSFNMNDLLNESKRFIKQIVSKLLARKAESFDGLNFLNQIILKNEFTKIDIFTLNHDTVLEQFFENYGHGYNDGFQIDKDNFNSWFPQKFDNNDIIKLYKIHGSVNWQYYNQESWEDNRISKIALSKLHRFDIISNALIIIGTHNKMSDYIKDLYLELYYRFYKSLNSHNLLIVVGYGFNDRGINQKIFNWLFNPENKIIIIDPKVDEIKFKFHSYFFNEWDKNKKIIKISDKTENISWDTIKSDLNKN